MLSISFLARTLAEMPADATWRSSILAMKASSYSRVEVVAPIDIVVLAGYLSRCRGNGNVVNDQI